MRAVWLVAIASDHPPNMHLMSPYLPPDQYTEWVARAALGDHRESFRELMDHLDQRLGAVEGGPSADYVLESALFRAAVTSGQSSAVCEWANRWVMNHQKEVANALAASPAPIPPLPMEQERRRRQP